MPGLHLEYAQEEGEAQADGQGQVEHLSGPCQHPHRLAHQPEGEPQQGQQKQTQGGVPVTGGQETEGEKPGVGAEQKQTPQ